ncbi:phage tail tape measure protein [Martelella alba]|uniref:Phage tail tape measure protein n=1 Tax=Martelella alba TaxID=2590451 RepID=A0A506U8L1_9HYPH|nr:phage tail tape measure protein [Martelella alba]TPW29441.1 phage tail tape measure protein [Martelella alba]
METDSQSIDQARDSVSALSDAFTELQNQSDAFAGSITQAMRDAVTGGKSLDTVLSGLSRRLSDVALKSALKPLETALSNGISGLAGDLANAVQHAKGGVPGRAMPFAKGGVVSSPTYFPMSGGLGLMGEAGTEAILPLKRGPDGSLGVAAGNGGGTSIVFNVSANDADSFRRSEAQISSMLARAVRAGQRNI